MSAHQCWKVKLELGRHEEKSKLEDNDRINTIMEEYLQEKPPSFATMQTEERSYSAFAFLCWTAIPP
jgi:hypothetical protein